MNQIRSFNARKSVSPMWLAVVMALGAIPVGSMRGTAAEPVISLEPGPSDVRSMFIAAELPESVLRDAARWNAEQWQKLFAVYTVSDARLAPAPLLGDYAIANAKVTFTPSYPLRRGVTYRAILRLDGIKASEEDKLSREFTVAENSGPRATLAAIFPTRDVLPENLLKFYLHFSAPMSRGEVYQKVRLRDQQGQVVEHPFLELAEELWSPDGKRLTLYFDPGRIKRGLKPRELFGPALVEGHSYTLEVSSSWPDAEGRPLKGPSVIKKTFRVTAPDDQQPDHKRWKISAPPPGSRQPLSIVFDEPLDSAMLERVIAVRDANGNPVSGSITVAKGETYWTFTPSSDWISGKYVIVVATSLEDVAGNSLGRPFEVDVFRPAPTQADAATASVPFDILPN